MSSTRRAADDTILHQCSHSSSQEFPRGLIANLVAKRVALLPAKADRELIWFIHYLSHEDGGLAAVADELIEKFSHRLGPAAMVKVTNRKSENFNAEEVREIRQQIPRKLRVNFPLRGEIDDEIRKANRDDRRTFEIERANALRDWVDEEVCPGGIGNVSRLAELDAADTRACDDAQKHPVSYPAESFREICRHAAKHGDEIPYQFYKVQFYTLERELYELCIDPEYDLTAGPWYFSDLVQVVQEYQQQWIKEKSKVVVTAIGRKVCETLEYTMEAGILSLLLGNASLGQSFAARAWCEQHPGQARYVEVPPSNDEASFYRAIARALGLGNFLNYKNVQIRERVEFVLQTGGVFLVLNHAERLWPQKNLREAFPGRLAWLLDQVDKGASACMISGPQFFMQGRACEKTGWDSPEFRKKIDHCDCLPDTLDVSDLAAVVRVMLPEATENIQDSVAIYAVASERYLAAIEAVTKRAQFIAQRNGRTQLTSQDVRAALTFVNGSDKMLRDSSDAAQKSSRKPHHIEPEAPMTKHIDSPAPTHEPPRMTVIEANNNRLAFRGSLSKTPINQKYDR